MDPKFVTSNQSVEKPQLVEGDGITSVITRFGLGSTVSRAQMLVPPWLFVMLTQNNAPDMAGWQFLSTNVRLVAPATAILFDRHSNVGNGNAHTGAKNRAVSLLNTCTSPNGVKTEGALKDESTVSVTDALRITFVPPLIST